MGTLGQKFKVILWKSYILRRRHWLLSLFEVFAPLFLFYLFTRYGNKNSFSQEYEIKSVKNMNTMIKELTGNGGDISYSRSRAYIDTDFRQIALAPYNPSTRKIINDLENKLNQTALRGNYNTTHFSKEAELSNWLNKASDNDDQLMIGIVFDEYSYKTKLHYTIRVHKDKSPPSDGLFGYKRDADEYFASWFLLLQMILDMNFIKEFTNKTFKMGLQEFPDFAYEKHNFANFVFPVITTFSFVFIIPAIIKKIVEEKLSGIKELQKMMGLHSWMLWAGWMVHSLMVYGVSIIVITIMFKIHWEGGSLLVYQVDSWLVIWYLFLIFIITAVLFCYAVSTFFTNPNIAVNVGIVLWMGPPLMLHSILTSVHPGSKIIQLATCLSPPVCLSWAFSIFTSFQDKGKEWSWSMFLEKGTTGGLSMAHVVFMFYFDWLLFAFITWYMDSVRPGKFGRAKPFYFIFQLWKKNITSTGYTEVTDQSSFEAPPRDTKIGISIQNLRKVFGSKVAVDKVDLDIYEGEITALLGHNGAGKTTTMSILTGLFSPTNGAVIVDGCNIFDNMDKFRLNLGLCPQHDLLFSYLTTIEHLVFFGMLKGLTMDQARAAGYDLLAVFHIHDKANQFVSQLSGGMKRKLCLSMALIGDPKILMLDEPTSGMDPESRRDVWDILLTYRGERTILITTHFMEEADILGDRIAIMDHGRVSCYGTSIFLKKLYGTGYQIVISKDMKKSEIDISRMLEAHLSEPQLKSSLPSQLTYNVSANDVPQFSSLFGDLEAKKSELGITGISIGCTTMEDVFLRVAEGGLHSEVKAIPAQVTLSPVLPAVNTKTREDGWRLILQQLKALLVKKMLVIKRSWLSTSLHVLMPLLMALSVLLNEDYAGGNELTTASKELNLALYPDTEVPYTSNYHKNMEKEYQNLVNNLGSKPQKYTTNISEALIAKVSDDNSYYRKAVVGAEFNKTLITGLHNGWAYHAAPITINLITNAILKDFKPTASVAVSTHPFSGNIINTEEQCDRMELTVKENALQQALHWLNLALGLMVIVVGFVTQPLVERASSAKQLQLMSRLSPFVYWASHFLWDFLLYLVAMVLVVAAIWILDAEEMLTVSGKMYLLFFLLLLHGLSAIPFTYLITFTTKSSDRAVLLLVLFNIATGVIAPPVTLLVNLFMVSMPNPTLVLIDALLCLNPLYAGTSALLRLLTVMIKDSACHRCPQFCDSSHLLEMRPRFSFNWSIRQFVIFLVVDWALYWFLIFTIEFGLLKTWWAKTESLRNGPMFKSSVVDDDDVIEEKQKAKTTLKNNYKEGPQPVLRVCGLGKKYNRKTVAVHEVSFLVEKGQCFGLLGVNGAGKSTTFKMLTGDESPTVGTASISSYDLVHSKAKYLGEIGYCPQSDAIIDKLTGEEMLCLYSTLRGTPLYKVDSEVDHWLHFMGLEEFSKAQCGTYSGGNKRKLSTAMALIGDPPVVFLDEPTAGVDPVSRRKLWDVLVQCQSTGQAIVLTSHSMEECEALCSRLTILVGGYMKCIGTTQYLKQKFGQGYTIKIKLSSTGDSDTDLLALKNDVHRTLANCLIKDEHKGLLHYHLTDSTVLLSVLFSKLEHFKQSHSIIEDYTVGDTTLEQVFMSFAKQVPPSIVIEPVDV